jgi:hypothetical protein
MEFEVTTRSAGELCEKLRQVTLRGGKVQPYLNSFISIETIDPLHLSLAQRYVLIAELKKIENLRWDIQKEYGWDILRLNGYLKVGYYADGAETAPRRDGSIPISQTIDVLPPVCEEWVDFRGKPHIIVSDGAHRVFLAYQMGLPLNIVYVRGVNKSYPYYSYPIPTGFSEVEILDKLEDGYIKKFHVMKESKVAYRDYNSQFENIGDSRKVEVK